MKGKGVYKAASASHGPFTIGINQITDTKPWSHCTGFALPTLLFILQSVDLFNVLIAYSSGLYPAFLLFIGVSGIRNMPTRRWNSFPFCTASCLHPVGFEKAPAVEL